MGLLLDILGISDFFLKIRGWDYNRAWDYTQLTTIFGLNHRLNNKKGGKEFKLLKTSKEQSRKSKTTHKRVKLPNYPLQRAEVKSSL